MSPCDDWEGSLNTTTGYGQVYLGKVNGRSKFVGAHRLVMMQEVGHLERWEFVCHRCDNRKCINLDHLFVGSHSDNARDMVAKGRQHQQVKTHCPSGHEYTEENTALRTRTNGPCKGNLVRVCKACDRKKALHRYYENRDLRIEQMRANRLKRSNK